MIPPPRNLLSRKQTKHRVIGNKLSSYSNALVPAPFQHMAQSGIRLPKRNNVVHGPFPIQHGFVGNGPVHKGQHIPGNGNTGPGVPSLADYLFGDSAYQSQLSAYQNALQQYLAQNQYQQGNINQDFNTALQRLGVEKQRDTRNITNDFAGRGLLYSGGLPRSLDEYNQDYLNQVTDLNTDKQRNLQNLIFQAQQTRNTVNNEITAAKQEAIRRRAQRYGLIG